MPANIQDPNQYSCGIEYMYHQIKQIDSQSLIQRLNTETQFIHAVLYKEKRERNLRSRV